MKRLSVQTLGILFFLVFSYHIFNSATSRAHIYRLSDQTTPSLAELVNDIVEVQLIFIGESHDNLSHHAVQLQIIRALNERGAKFAIGLEMFRSDSQKHLDQWVAGELPLGDFVNIFNKNWNSWEMYSEIFHYAKDHTIPMVGLNLDKAVIKQVARDGFSSLSEERLKDLPVTACVVDPEYEKFIRRAFGWHNNNGTPFKNFCEAQLLWDSVMAKNLVRFLEQNAGYTIVVLAGTGHSWKHGIPAQLEIHSDYSYRVLLPVGDGGIDEENVTPADADYLFLGVEQVPLH